MPVRALWYSAPEQIEIRPTELAMPGAGEVLVRTLWSGVSRGTERLVSRGEVPEAEWDRMRCPAQEGSFPFPVKYGYSLVGQIESGSDQLRGRVVFALHPHQTKAVLREETVILLPDAMPPRRAVLAANMETALNGLWDSGAGPGDRVVVVGGGVIGCLLAYLAGRLPGAEVTLVDSNPARHAQASQLGVKFADPQAAPQDADIVFHASASEAGLATALSCAGLEAVVCELSWYGSRPVKAALGGAFHSQRLKLISSQVSLLPADRRARWTHRRRLALALELLQDARLDVLLATEIEFDEAPRALPALFDDPTVLGIVIHHSDKGQRS